jgi:hypothetical protein
VHGEPGGAESEAIHGMTGDDADQIIREATRGIRHLTEADLRPLLAHVAASGFDPLARERARGELAGIRWQGQVLRGRDQLPPVQRHFLKHVVLRKEWPLDTGLTDYVDSIRRVISDASSGVFTSRYQGEDQLGVIRETRELRGPYGSDWILIEYRASTGHWVTAFQPGVGILDLLGSGRTNLRWWREPTYHNG